MFGSLIYTVSWPVLECPCWSLLRYISRQPEWWQFFSMNSLFLSSNSYVRKDVVLRDIQVSHLLTSNPQSFPSARWQFPSHPNPDVKIINIKVDEGLGKNINKRDTCRQLSNWLWYLNQISTNHYESKDAPHDCKMITMSRAPENQCGHIHGGDSGNRFPYHSSTSLCSLDILDYLEVYRWMPGWRQLI